MGKRVGTREAWRREERSDDRSHAERAAEIVTNLVSTIKTGRTYSNTGSGVSALFSNTTGFNNLGIGNGALFDNTTGSNNTAVGYLACYNVVTGSNVICIGSGAGPAGDISGPATYIANVYGAATTGSGNPFVCVDSTGLLGTTNCATNGEEFTQQRLQVEALQKQNEELQRRLSRIEALLAKK